jgi:REP element-mobilizing transposase RayT
MPRRPRHFEPDTIYHVTDRGVDRRPIFVTDGDRQYFLGLLHRELKAAGCSLLADCLMPNHFHVLISVSTIPLGVPFHAALTKYASRFNSANDRVGHLFQSRYYSTPIRSLPYLHNVITYIHENPVRARLAPSVDAWAWSSHRDWVALSAGRIDFKRVEELTGVSAMALRDAYLERVELMANGGPAGLDVKAIIADTAHMLGLNPDEMTAGNRGGTYTRARDMAIQRALKAGHPAVEIAGALNCTEAAVSLSRRRRT